MAGLVQAAVNGSGTNTVTTTLGATPTVGNLLVFAWVGRDNVPNTISGVTLIGTSQSGAGATGNANGRFGYRVVQSGDPAGWTATTPGTDSPKLAIAEFKDISGGLITSVATSDTLAQGPSATPTMTLAPGSGTFLEVAYFFGGLDGAPNQLASVGAGWTQATAINNGAGDAFQPYLLLEYRVVLISANPTAATANVLWGGAGLAFVTATIPVANFTGSPTSGTAPLAVSFTDTSTLIPTSWAWTFGDGGTSTQQNPNHVYSAPGTYTVSLIATNADGSDTETKVAYIVVSADMIYDVYQVVPPGTSIVGVGTLSEATQKSIRPVLNGVGSGIFAINKNSGEATADAIAVGNLIKVRIPDIDADPIFAFWLDQGDYTLLDPDEEGGEDFTFGGDGILKYLNRAVWRNYKYSVEWWPADMADPPAGAGGLLRVQAGRYRFFSMTGSPLEVNSASPFSLNTVAEFDSYFEDLKVYDWDFANGKGKGQLFLVRFMTGQPQAAAWMSPTQNNPPAQMILPSWSVGGEPIKLTDVGSSPGAVLYRMIEEAQHADRPAQPIPLLSVDFSATLDSNGDAWSPTDALNAITASVGEDYLTTLGKLLETGVIDVEMTPDFVLHAYNSLGRDLTGAFGTGIVRFEKGVNISERMKRELVDAPVATHAEIATTIYGGYQRADTELADAATRVTRELFVIGESQEETELEALGLAVLGQTLRRSDALIFESVTGDDEATGLYLPGPEGTDNGRYWLGDTVSVHTGTGEQDFNEAELRVWAVSISEGEAGQLRALPEVSSVTGEAERRLYANPVTYQPRPSPEGGGSGGASGGGGTPALSGAPDDGTYLVTTAHAGLSAEVAVGATPGGELGGTWASPTVDATHSGSTHSAASDTHVADTSAAHVASSIGFTPNGSIAATDVQAAIQEVRDEAAGGSGALVLLEQHTASASASLDFTTFISATYDTYLIEGVELILATNGAHLYIEAGTGGGPTWDTGTNYEWAMTGRTSGGAAATDNGAGAGCRIFNALANAAGYGFGTFSLTASGLQSASLRKTLHGTVEYVNTGPAAVYGMWGMQYTPATVVTALRFIASSGNITSGTIRIYGLTK